MEWNMQEQGSRVTIRVRQKDEGDGLYKAWAVGEHGRVLLGTLVPEQGGLCLSRTLSVDSLRRQGAWPVNRMLVERSFSFQKDSDAIQWEDEVLRQSARNLPQHTLRRNGEGFTLQFPFDPFMPFPLVPVFCFATVENGWLIFSFQKGGLPNIFQDRGKDKGEADLKRREHHGKSDHQGAGCAGGSAGF